jgi:hypothetical protein
MKKQALRAIIVLVILVTVVGAGCTTPTTRNNTVVGNVSKMGNGSARSPTLNNITAQFNMQQVMLPKRLTLRCMRYWLSCIF